MCTFNEAGVSRQVINQHPTTLINHVHVQLEFIHSFIHPHLPLHCNRIHAHAFMDDDPLTDISPIATHPSLLKCRIGSPLRTKTRYYKVHLAFN